MNPLEMVAKELRQYQRENWYKEMVKLGEVEGLSDITAPRLVVLVRDDLLPPIHQGLQAMHAVITLASKLAGSQANTILIDPRCYLILLGIQDAIDMQSIRQKAHKKVGKISVTYSDPGLIDPETGEPPITACAFEEMTHDELKRVFGGLKRAE